MNSSFWKTNVGKTLKALGYSFCSGFLGVTGLMALDFIHAAQTGTGSVVNLTVALICAGVVGGINAVVVFIEKTFFSPNTPNL